MHIGLGNGELIEMRNNTVLCTRLLVIFQLFRCPHGRFSCRERDSSNWFGFVIHVLLRIPAFVNKQSQVKRVWNVMLLTGLLCFITLFNHDSCRLENSLILPFGTMTLLMQNYVGTKQLQSSSIRASEYNSDSKCFIFVPVLDLLL